MHDDAVDKLEDTRGGTYTTQTREEIPTILSPSPKCAPTEDEKRDQYALRKAEAIEPLELVLLDPSWPEATARIGMRLTIEMRDTL